MEIKKENIKLCDQTVKSYTGALVEGDIVVPDTNPDMAEILVADAKVRVTDTEYRNGILSVGGAVLFCALYKPDAGAEIKTVEGTLPFLQNIEIKASEDATFDVNASVEHIGFTLVNSRKLAAKVMVALMISAKCEKTYEAVTDICGDDAQCRNKKYCLHIPVSSEMSEFTVSDILTLDDEKPDIGELIKINTYIKEGDEKVMNSKAMVHAELVVDTLYTAADDGRLMSASHKIPFTEIIDAPGADEQSMLDIKFEVVDVSAGTKGDLNGDTKLINLDARIQAVASVSKNVAQELADDCYCLTADTQAFRNSMKIAEYITSEKTRITQRQTVEVPKNVKIDEVINCCVKPVYGGSVWENGTAKMQGTLVSFVIYRDTEGMLRNAVAQSDINWEMPISDQCRLTGEMNLYNTSVEMSDDTVQILANLNLNMKAVKERSVDYISDIEIKNSANEDNGAAMVIYFAADGDTVWSVAKKYRVKEEKIRSANNLTGERIEAGRRLFIPTI